MRMSYLLWLVVLSLPGVDAVSFARKQAERSVPENQKEDLGEVGAGKVTVEETTPLLPELPEELNHTTPVLPFLYNATEEIDPTDETDIVGPTLLTPEPVQETTTTTDYEVTVPTVVMVPINVTEEATPLPPLVDTTANSQPLTLITIGIVNLNETLPPDLTTATIPVGGEEHREGVVGFIEDSLQAVSHWTLAIVGKVMAAFEPTNATEVVSPPLEDPAARLLLLRDAGEESNWTAVAGNSTIVNDPVITILSPVVVEGEEEVVVKRGTLMVGALNPVLSHEIGAGSPCLKCDCIGLNLHFWRKICNNCRCRLDEHDVILPDNGDHGEMVIRRLFDFHSSKPKVVSPKKESLLPPPPSNALKDHQPPPPPPQQPPLSYSLTPEYAWVPSGPAHLVSRYMLCLPAEERPLLGSEGAQLRRQRLVYQLPMHDCDPEAAKSLALQSERDSYRSFVDYVKQKVVGIGELVDPSALIGSGGCRGCRGCRKGFSNNDGEGVAVTTEHAQKNEVWHPSCFRCETCHQLLGDLIYFHSEGKYFCGRHYGERAYNRCGGCDELIFSKEYTHAEDKSWHVEHFCCLGCDVHLGGHRYVTKENSPYCLDCYMNKFAKSCATCHEKIAPSSTRVSHKDLSWHESSECFKCLNCSKPLMNQKFLLKGEQIYCSVECKRQGK